MPEKSSYYTGYEDLDAKLLKLYGEQARAEKEGRDTSKIIMIQDGLLEDGKIRDRYRGCE